MDGRTDTGRLAGTTGRQEDMTGKQAGSHDRQAGTTTGKQIKRCPEVQ